MDARLLTIRTARLGDVGAIVQLLANDVLGNKRERFEEPLPLSYYEAFEAIEIDPNNALIVGEYGGRVICVLQLTFIPNMTYQGGWRGQIEGVQVAADMRGRGFGRALIEHAIEKSRLANCHLVQLTTDKQRPEAIRFYESLGFQASHEGMKLSIASTPTC